MNAKHAKDNAHATKAATLDLLRAAKRLEVLAHVLGSDRGDVALDHEGVQPLALHLLGDRKGDLGAVLDRTAELPAVHVRHFEVGEQRVGADRPAAVAAEEHDKPVRGRDISANGVRRAPAVVRQMAGPARGERRPALAGFAAGGSGRKESCEQLLGRRIRVNSPRAHVPQQLLARRCQHLRQYFRARQRQERLGRAGERRWQTVWKSSRT